MKKLLMLAGLMLAQDVSAKPYFRFEPLNDIKTTAVFPLAGNTDGMGFGTDTAVLRHHSEDGYLFLPGVSWDLLDAGAVKGDHWKAILGPSVDLSEPVKQYALWALDKLTGQDQFGALRWAFKPQDPNAPKRWNLSLGPSLEVDPGDGFHLKQFKGAFVWHVGGAVKF